MKNQIRNAKELQDRMQELEDKKVALEEYFSHSWHATKKELNPINLVKDGISSLVSIDLTKNKYVNTVLGLGLGFLTNRLVAGSSKSILRKIAGAALEVGVTNTVSNKLPRWTKFMRHLFSKNGTHS